MSTAERPTPRSPSRARARALYERAQRVLAGGVSSDARRLQPLPLYVDRGAGARLWDVDGNEYVDYVLGQGPLILGHSAPAVVEAVQAQVARGQAYSAQHEQEVEVAETICRLCRAPSGCASTASAPRRSSRLAPRPGDHRPQPVLKFEGHYHGWLDSVLSRHDRARPPRAAWRRWRRPAGSPGALQDLGRCCPWNDLGVLAGFSAATAARSRR